MTQTRVFVTYLPERSAPGRARARSLGSRGAPAATVLAGAIFAGGLVHALGGAGAIAQRDARVTFDAAPNVGAGVSQEALPLLALASTEITPPLDFSPARLAAPPAGAAQRPTGAAPVVAQTLKAVAPVASPQPVAGKRLDLEGFLDEQGYALAAGATAAEDASSPAESPLALAPATELALAQGGIAPRAAPSTQPQAAAQTFPAVMVDGVELGAVTMRGDDVHLGSLVGLLELRMPADKFARLKGAPAADSFVSIDTLRAAGLDVTVEADGETLALAAN